MTKNFLVLILALVALLVCCPLSTGADDRDISPKVVMTTPSNGATDVDPALSKITVTFNKPMLDKSWSWSYEDKSSFPQMAGQPYYSDEGTTCVLPVRWEPGMRYIIWINTAKFKNFKDKKGGPAEPYKLTFATSRK
ncbi:MAG: Ig-like domain-containing protein [Thermodesulfobacteriota bacterium]